MNRARFASFLILALVLSAIIIWTLSQLSRQLNPFSDKKMLAFQEHQFLDRGIHQNTNSLTEYSSLDYKVRLMKSSEGAHDSVNYKQLSLELHTNTEAICSWTKQRVELLHREIKVSGVGSDSQHCEEFALRRVQLDSYAC